MQSSELDHMITKMATSLNAVKLAGDDDMPVTQNGGKKKVGRPRKSSKKGSKGSKGSKKGSKRYSSPKRHSKRAAMKEPAPMVGGKKRGSKKSSKKSSKKGSKRGSKRGSKKM